ncbi:MAG: bifunctional riboflavin kinase/FAD synthetase [Proteobacteria bacterium]|nr:bifunctional riboflavin kinase/FAD synthetase [Pseudomonadota bacterium]
MQLYPSLAALGDAIASPTVAPTVVVGNFDGVHRGHQALLSHARALATAERGMVVALTFEPHPTRFFAAASAPPLLTTRSQQLALLAAHGVDITVIEPFDAAFAALSPRAFAERALVQALGARHVVVGVGFVFGQRRAGTVEALRLLGAELGFTTHGLEPARSEGTIISSTRVRELVVRGDLPGAARLLGRCYALTGRVERGAGRGGTIGVPTANLQPDNELLPARGVYAARATLPDGSTYGAAVNIGHAPTFARHGAPLVEAHLLEFQGQLLGQQLELTFVERLREEERFPSAEALVAAIRRDLTRARACLARSTEPAPE